MELMKEKVVWPQARSDDVFHFNYEILAQALVSQGRNRVSTCVVHTNNQLFTS